MSSSDKIRFLAISGSLRSVSSNLSLLRAMAALAPDNVEISLYESVGILPHFNPDLDNATPPEAVIGFRAKLKAADAVLISSPEYAHGVPGALKNALDWIVGSGEFMYKPVGLMNASPTSRYAQASLAETLTVMMARVTTYPVPHITGKTDEAIILANPVVCNELLRAISELSDAVRENREN